MDALFGFFDHIVSAIELLFFGMIAAAIGVSVLPEENPLRALLVSLTRHLAATFAIGMVAIPVQPLPGIDVAYDTASMVFLLWYWGTFALALMGKDPPLRRQGPIVDGEATYYPPQDAAPRQASSVAKTRSVTPATFDMKGWNPLSDFERRH